MQRLSIASIETTIILYLHQYVPLRLMLPIATVVAYVLAFATFYHPTEPWVLALSVLPAAAIGWGLGLTGGLLVGLLLLPLNTLLLNLAGQPAWEVMVWGAGLPSSIVAIAVGALVGRLRDLREQVTEPAREHVHHNGALQEPEGKRKGADEMLKEADEDWTRTFDSMADSVSIHDTSGNVLKANRALVELLGIPRDELTNMKCYTAFHCTGEFIPGCPMIASMLSKRPQTSEYFDSHLDRWLSISVSPVLDDSGEVKRVVHVARDITERKGAEEALRASVEIATIVTSSLDVRRVFPLFAAEVRKVVPFDEASIALVTEEGDALRIAYQSAEGPTPFGEGDLVPLEGSATEWVLTNRRTRVVNDLAVARHLVTDERAFQAGYRSVIWVPLVANDQGIGSFLLRSHRPNAFGPREQTILEHLARQLGPAVENARLYGRLEASGEECMRQETQLRRAHEFNQRLIDSVPTAIVVVKPDLEVVFANRVFYPVMGLKKQNIEGKHLPNVLRLNGIKPLLSAALKSKKSFGEREIIYRHPRRGRRWFRVSASRLLGQAQQHLDQEDILFILSLDDVTEWRQAQEKIQATGQLISLGEIVASVAHELNNPLCSVRGFAQLLIEQEPEGANRAELEIIFSEAERATKVVRNLLAFVRKHKAEKRWVDLAATMERVLALRSYALSSSNIRVETDFASDLPNAYTDEHQLEQVFLNIVTNAQQAMAQGNQRGRLFIQGRREDRMLRISFQDDGPGIPPNQIKTIFDPFVTSKEPGQGTGLGLSICKSLVQDQGGRIWAESEVGKGAVFHVELPVHEG